MFQESMSFSLDCGILVKGKSYLCHMHWNIWCKTLDSIFGPRAKLCAFEAGSFSNLKYPLSAIFFLRSISDRPVLLQHSEALQPYYHSNIGLLSILNSRRKAKFLIQSETFCKIFHLPFILTHEQCSVSCGQGIKRRKVACDAVGSKEGCDSSAVPISWSRCNKGPCPKIFAIPYKIKVS